MASIGERVFVTLLGRVESEKERDESQTETPRILQACSSPCEMFFGECSSHFLLSA
jgi:hypothetical protein